MIDIQALRGRLENGVDAAAVAASIQDEPEILGAYLGYECMILAQEGTRQEVEAMLWRLEAWRKGAR